MDNPAPQPELFIHEIETIKVMADSLRMKILAKMQMPTTVKAVAAALETPISSLYYHINLLQQHGLIRVVDHNIDSGIVEKIYQVTARQFKIRNPMLSGDALPDDTVGALFSSMLEETQADLRRALPARHQDGQTPPRHPFFSKKAFRLTDEQLTAFHARLDALIKEIDALNASNPGDAGAPFELTVIFFRQRQESKENDHE